MEFQGDFFPAAALYCGHKSKRRSFALKENSRLREKFDGGFIRAKEIQADGIRATRVIIRSARTSGIQHEV